MGRRKKILVIPFLVGAMFVAGIGFAQWTSNGTGSVAPKSTTDVASVIAPDSASADLYPGATGSASVTISNPNPYPVVVNSISAGSSALVNGTCTAGSVTTDARALDATGLLQSDGVTKTIAAGGSGTYVLVTHMTTSAVDACKSQTFSVPLTASLTSSS
jgi:hypothetical protein